MSGKAGDGRLSAEERDRITRGLAGWVWRIAESYHHWARRVRPQSWAASEFDEVLSVARLGLAKALDQFDTRRGVKPISYATVAIRHALAARGAEETRMRRAPAGGRVVSLGDLDALGLGGFDPADPSAPEPPREADRSERAAAVRKALASIPRLEREILTARYFNGETQNEIAKRVRLSRVSVRLVELRARERLRKRLAPLADL